MNYVPYLENVPSTVSPAWADNMPLDTLNEAIGQNTALSAAGTPTETSQRYWATPARSAASATKDVMEINFATERLINHLTFDAVIFPHSIYVEYYDAQLKTWVPLMRQNSAKADPVRETILESQPATLPPSGSVPGHLHPQHSFSGHWATFTVHARPTLARRLRFVLARTTSGTPPRNNLNQPVDYSLAIRNLDVGYRVDSKAGVPRRQGDPASWTQKKPFASTVDMLGSAVDFSIRTNAASNVLKNRKGQTSPRVIWKSEPQPFPWAVVNFYADARNNDGSAQVLDRFYIEPVTEGPSLNLYYSNDEPTTNFEAGDDSLRANTAVVTGESGRAPLHFGNTDKYSFVDIDNEAISFNPGKKWWMGWDLSFNYTYTNQTENHALLDCGAFTLAITPSGFRFTSSAGHTFVVDPEQYMPASIVRLVMEYDGSAVQLYVRVDDRHYGNSATLTVPLPDGLIKEMRFGGFNADDPGISAYDLNGFVLKINEVMDTDKLADFLDDPEPYCRKPELADDDENKTDNAILRNHPSYYHVDYPSCFVGGPPDHYADMEWTPIARDYVLRKGFLYFPPTRAKYWKMEFCRLTPQPYEVYVPVKRKCVTYTYEMWQRVVKVKAYTSLTVRMPGLSVSLGLSLGIAGRSYIDSIGGRFGASFSAARGRSATTVRVANDIHIGVQLGSIGWSFNFMSMHGTVVCPRFQKKIKHVYEKIEVTERSKIGYFVGLQVVEAYRLDYLAEDDTAQYVEEFHDDANLAQDTNWVINQNNQLTSGSSTFAQATSEVFASNKAVRAVQFAAIQTEPRQILPDPDFDDFDHSNWKSFGDGTLAKHASITDVVGNTLRVDRSDRGLVWDYLDSLSELQEYFSTWGAIQGRALTFAAIESYGNPQQPVGGITSNDYSTPPGGRVYAAARVVAPKALSSPLWVQIVDSETSNVLSESPADVGTNQVVEWYTSYTIGEGGKVLAHRWSDFSVSPSYASYLDTFVRNNEAVLGTLDTNQAWSANTDSNGSALALSLNGNEAVQTNSSGLGRSWVDVRTPWGAMEVTLGAMGTGQTAGAPLVEFEPFTVRDDGSLWVDATRSFGPSSAFGRALVAGDKLRIESFPTRYLPVNYFPAGFNPADHVSNSYSLVLSLNGIWVRTINMSYGIRTVRALRGRTGQRFRGFSWTPNSFDTLPGPVFSLAPFVANNGAWADDRLTWTSKNDTSWAPIGSWNSSGNFFWAESNLASAIVDTKYWYGTLIANVTHVAHSTNGQRHGNVMCLDYDNKVYLDYQGNVVREGISYGNVIPNGVADGNHIFVQFLDSKQVPVSIRGSIDPERFPRMIVVRVAGAVTGVLGDNFVQTWTGTKRGVAGDLYNPGSDEYGNLNAMPAGDPWTLHTSFNHFSWAPNTSEVAINPNAPKWEEVNKKNTQTYAQASKYLLLNKGKLRARVVQKGESNEVWNMDNLSMFVDPIVWYFSNDGGKNFYPAYDIRNNPSGVLAFPERDYSQAFNMNFGQQLVWRVVSYAPDCLVSNLVVRPWYAGLLSGITHRLGAFTGDPNVMPYDHYPPIEQDSRFQTWNLPVPQDWWYHFRLLNRSKDAAIEAPTVLMLPENVVSDTGGTQ